MKASTRGVLNLTDSLDGASPSEAASEPELSSATPSSLGALPSVSFSISSRSGSGSALALTRLPSRLWGSFLFLASMID